MFKNAMKLKPSSLFLLLSPQKCLKFNVDAPIWLSKQRILCTLNQSLKDVLNYGLFQPAYNGRAGKFLDEERRLREYPFPSIAPVPYLEVGVDHMHLWGFHWCMIGREKEAVYATAPYIIVFSAYIFKMIFDSVKNQFTLEMLLYSSNILLYFYILS